MPSFKRLTVAAVAAASLAVAGTAPATASEIDSDARYCGGQITLPDCVNWTFDTAQRGVETARTTWNGTIQPTLDGGLCAAYTLATGEPCPTQGMVPRL